jgi:hypothetical protein
LPSAHHGYVEGVGYALIILLALLGVGTLFITPWVGAGFIVLTVVAGIVVLGGSLLGERADVRDQPVDTGLPGPGDPRSGVDTGTREL